MEIFVNDITGKYVFELIPTTFTAKLTKINNITDSDIIIPSSITSTINSVNTYIKIVELDCPEVRNPVFSANVRSVTVPPSITAFSRLVFSRLNNLQKIIFEEPCKITKIPFGAFSFSGLTEITIPSSITSIDSYAFNTSLIKTITIPSTVKTMGINLFFDNPTLKSIYFLGECPTQINNPGVFEPYIFSGATNIIIYYYAMYKKSFKVLIEIYKNRRDNILLIEMPDQTTTSLNTPSLNTPSLNTPPSLKKINYINYILLFLIILLILLICYIVYRLYKVNR
jgi:hypothetical protein